MKIINKKNRCHLSIVILCLILSHIMTEYAHAANLCQITDYFRDAERSDGVVELRCLHDDEMQFVEIDFNKLQCVRFVETNSAEIKEHEILEWTDNDCQKYRARAKETEDEAINFQAYYKSGNKENYERVEQYLKDGKMQPPREIISLLRLLDPDNYPLAKDIFLALSANSNDDLKDVIFLRDDLKKQPIEIIHQDLKETVWSALAMFYLQNDNDHLALEIMAQQFDLQPFQQFAKVASMCTSFAEREGYDTTKYNQKAIKYWQKSLNLEWNTNNAEKLVVLLEKEQRIDEAAKVWRHIIKSGDRLPSVKCTFIKFLIRHDKQDEAIEIAYTDHFYECAVQELMEHELYEEVIHLILRGHQTNQYDPNPSAFLWSALAEALYHTGDKRGAVAALQDGDKFTRLKTWEDYKYLLEASKKTGHKNVAKQISNRMSELKKSPIVFAVHSDKKKSVTEPVTGMEFVWVPTGCLQMGTVSMVWGPDDNPAHSICLDGFYLGKYEVTQEQYYQVMGVNPSINSGVNLPVENVNWNDTQKFIKQFAQLSGMEFRLPTEAEWEFAARGGRGWRNQPYSGGYDQRDVAWCYDNSEGKPHPVGLKQANTLGLYDMTGNVYEWCQDWYGGNYYKNSPRRNPQGPSSGTLRVFRGGAWNGVDDIIKVTRRDKANPSQHSASVGFRLVLQKQED